MYTCDCQCNYIYKCVLFGIYKYTFVPFYSYNFFKNTLNFLLKYNNKFLIAIMSNIEEPVKLEFKKKNRKPFRKRKKSSDEEEEEDVDFR